MIPSTLPRSEPTQNPPENEEKRGRKDKRILVRSATPSPSRQGLWDTSDTDEAGGAAKVVAGKFEMGGSIKEERENKDEKKIQEIFKADDKDARLRFERLETEIKHLYGPLHALCIEKKRGWEGFCTLYPPLRQNKLFDSSQTSVENGALEAETFLQDWRTWHQEVIHPCNQKIVEALRSNMHLINYHIYGKTRVMELIGAIFAHVASWKARIGSWVKHDSAGHWTDRKRNTSLITYPKEFDKYVNDCYEQLRNEHASLLAILPEGKCVTRVSIPGARSTMVVRGDSVKGVEGGSRYRYNRSYRVVRDSQPKRSSDITCSKTRDSEVVGVAVLEVKEDTQTQMTVNSEATEPDDSVTHGEPVHIRENSLQEFYTPTPKIDELKPESQVLTEKNSIFF